MMAGAADHPHVLLDDLALLFPGRLPVAPGRLHGHRTLLSTVSSISLDPRRQRRDIA